MFFQLENVTERIYRITMPYVCCYLIVGKNKAVLIDSGWGYGDIKEIVESVTDLPITLLLSHGHPDHNGSAIQFNKAYLNKKDFKMNESQIQIAFRRQIMLMFVPDEFEENPDRWQNPRTQPYRSLKEKVSFNLGGLTILPFNLPGHSAGSMVFIVPEERIAIFGDAISHPTVMFLDNSTKIKLHYEAMVELSNYSHLYDRVLVNHETFEIDKIVLDNNIKLAKAILDGKDEKVMTSKRTQKLLNSDPIYAARKPQPWLPTDPRKIGNIYYKRDKL